MYHSERFVPEKMRVLGPKRTVQEVLDRMTNDRRLTKVLRKRLKCLINFEFFCGRNLQTRTHVDMHRFYVIRVLALIDNHMRQQQQNEQYYYI